MNKHFLFNVVCIFLFAILFSGVASQRYANPHCLHGNNVIVQLFEWRWVDIALECERFLSRKSYCGVQVSPPNENAIIKDGEIQRPWWERYQPVSYKTYSRSGTEREFNDMVRRCNKVGVRIFVDIVMNNMCHESLSNRETGLWGSYYDTDKQSFPAVPYIKEHFNRQKSEGGLCTSGSGNIEDRNNMEQVKWCRREGLLDLNHESKFVQDRIAEWLNRLIRTGVAGFHFSGAQYMWSDQIKMILEKMDNLPTKWFENNSKPFVYLEVVDFSNEPIKPSHEYANSLAHVTEFKYAQFVSKAFRGTENAKLSDLHSFGSEWGLLKSDRAIVFIDNQDNQRGANSPWVKVPTFWEEYGRLYKKAVTFMLAWPYGMPKGGPDQNIWMGPPHDKNYNTLGVKVNGDDSCGETFESWRCEHRWRQIYNMVEFRRVAVNEPVENWWTDGAMQIAFSRGGKAFYVINNSANNKIEQWFHTGLPQGVYCDVISGNISANRRQCTGKNITLNEIGGFLCQIEAWEQDPMIAIHLESKLI